jgi:hypothetical protein
MAIQSIYIRPADAELWERFEAEAQRRRSSVSALLAMLVEKFMGEVDDAQA